MTRRHLAVLIATGFILALPGRGQTPASPIVSTRTVVDHGVEAPVTTVLQGVVSDVVSFDSGGFKEWIFPSSNPGPEFDGNVSSTCARHENSP